MSGFSTDTTAPTAQWIFDKSKLRWNRLGYSGPDDLDDVREEAIAYVTWITARYFDDFVPNSIPASATNEYSYTPVAISGTPELISVMRRAVLLRSQQDVVQNQDSYVETAGDDLIQSFTAGSYSETRRDTASLRGGTRADKPLLNSYPGLNDALMLLMTDERREYWTWVLTGATTPGFVAEEVDWSLIGKAPLFPTLADPMAPTPPIGVPWWE